MIRLSLSAGCAMIADRESSAQFWPSSALSDPLGDLVRATVSLLRGAEQARVSWQDERGEWRWLLSREDERLSIRILRFRETFSREPDARGTPIFETTCRLADFAGQVKSQLQELLEHSDPIDSPQVWRRQFPLADFDALRELVRSGRRTGRADT
jgi:hypothetical protein